jgi:hypothetical protein
MLILSLWKTSQDLEPAVWLPSAQQLFALHALFAGLLLLKSVQGAMPQQDKVFQLVIVLYALAICISSDAQKLVQNILDIPMRAHAPRDALSSGYPGRRITIFTTIRFADQTL